MRKCAEFKVSPTKTGKEKRVCARYESINDIALVPENKDSNGNMGIIVPEPIQGLGMIDAQDLIGPAIGLVSTGVGAVLARRFGDNIHEKVSEYWGLAGAAFGVLASMGLYYVKGTTPMISAAVSSVMLGLGLQFIPTLVGEFGYCDGDYGLITAEPIGMLPEVLDAGQAPQTVYAQTDVSAYGKVM